MEKVSVRPIPKDTLMEALGIEIVELNQQRVVATMPVNGAIRQPFGMLHGGWDCYSSRYSSS